MAYANILDGTTADAADLQQLIDSFNGVSGKGQPLDLIQLDADRYYLAVKNLHANGKCAQMFAADGTLLLQVGVGGVLASTAGAAAAAIAPTASPTFSGVVTLGGSVIETRAANTASTGSLTLPAGKQIPITGTTAITSIAAGTAGRTVTLEFASAGCKILPTSTLRLKGGFVSSAAGDTLTLESDGTNWNEVARGQSGVQGVLCAAAGQTLTADAAYAAIALSAAASDRFTIKSGNTFVVPWTGLWRCEGSVQIEASASGNRNVAIHVGGVLVAVVGHGASLSGVNDYGCSWSLPMSLTATNVVDVRARSTTASLLVRTTSFSSLTYIGPV